VIFVAHNLLTSKLQTFGFQKQRNIPIWVMFSSLVLDYQPLSQLPPFSLNYVTIMCSLNMIKSIVCLSLLVRRTGKYQYRYRETHALSAVSPIIGATVAIMPLSASFVVSACGYVKNNIINSLRRLGLLFTSTYCSCYVCL